MSIEVTGFSDEALNQIMEVIRPIIYEKDKEINRLNNIINKAIHRIQLLQMDGEVTIKDITELANILKGEDNE